MDVPALKLRYLYDLTREDLVAFVVKQSEPGSVRGHGMTVLTAGCERPFS